MKAKDKRLTIAVISLLIAASLGIFGYRKINEPLRIPAVSPKPSIRKIITFNADRQTYKVTEVLDGDTIRIDTGETVRYMGIDAPEKNDPWGLSAQRYNETLVLGKEVRLEFDRDKTDKYGRILAYVYAGDLFVNEKMTEEGYARVETFEKMRKPLLYEQLLSAQTWAKDHHNGMWLDEWMK